MNDGNTPPRAAGRAVQAGSAERLTYLIRPGADPLAGDGPNVVLNLSRNPKRISPVYIYDQHGTEIFERQCGTPEYYLRRAEFRLLNRYASIIVELTGFPSLVELGAGTAEKTRVLLAQYARRHQRCDYYPIDVDSDTLQASAAALVAEYRDLHVHCLCADYLTGLRALPARAGTRMFMILGSSIGNMEWHEVRGLLSALFAIGGEGDFLLLGADLDKDAASIDRAYNDAAGFGARSTLNMLAHLNRRYGGNFQLENFRYVSRYHVAAKRNEVRIESLIDQSVRLEALDFSVTFQAGEMIDAEVMLKFDPDELAAALAEEGFALLRRWIDPLYRYGLFLLVHR